MDALLLLVSATVFSLMLSIGINYRLSTLRAFLQDRTAVLQGLTAALLVFPGLAFLLLLLFDLPVEIATAIAILAACPGAPLITKRSQMVQADPDHVSSLQLVLAVSAAVVTPIVLSVFHRAFDLATENVTALNVGLQIVQVTLLPVVIGMVFRVLAPSWAEKLNGSLTRVANGLFVLMALSIVVVLVISSELRASLLIGWGPAFVILTLTVAAVVSGHLIGGPNMQRRAGVAIASLARNVGLALYIVELELRDGAMNLFPPILVYMLIGILVQVAYSLWLKKSSADQ